MTVAAAPSMDTMCTGFTMQTTQIMGVGRPPGCVTSVRIGCSSPGLLNRPSPSTSPYRPGPTITVLPEGALANAWVIDRQGCVCAPQFVESTPLLAAYNVPVVAAPVLGACRAVTHRTIM